MLRNNSSSNLFHYFSVYGKILCMCRHIYVHILFPFWMCITYDQTKPKRVSDFSFSFSGCISMHSLCVCVSAYIGQRPTPTLKVLGAVSFTGPDSHLWQISEPQGSSWPYWDDRCMLQSLAFSPDSEEWNLVLVLDGWTIFGWSHLPHPKRVLLVGIS